LTARKRRDNAYNGAAGSITWVIINFALDYRIRLFDIIKTTFPNFPTMLAVDQSTKMLLTSFPKAVHLVHHSTISLHHAKEGYDYPIIRLPHTFSKLLGLPTKIYQTIHDGALAFLVVISPSNSISENSAESPQSPALTWRRSPVRIRPSPSFSFL
jgi:hypothetical protein